MSVRRIGLILTSLLLLLAVLAGCGGTKTAPAPEAPKPAQESPKQEAPKPKQTTYPLTLKDAIGRDVTFNAEPKRIVSVAPSNTELVFALGKGGSLVGRSDFCDYPAEAAKIESVGGFFPPNYEKIIAAKPDLVLLVGGSKDAREKLINEYKLQVFVIDPKNFADLYAGIATLGQIVNAQEAAEKLVADMQRAAAAIEAKTAKAAVKPVVLYEVWHDPVTTAGPGTFIDDMIKIAGGTNAATVAGAKDLWPVLPLEQVVAANPAIIIAGSADAAKAVSTRKGWEGLKAVKEAKVFGVPDQNLVVRPGPRLVQGLQWFAEQIQPDLMKK